ncbi:ribonuclease domain-containing protein [Actinomadura rayongensis]|jgi:ribonuclease T1|uniref:Guanine-specific ribonuclease N1 and T1 n=1 Tax=Actinomadura rayongensis TaxID=1429076 RepID=A0A6I4W7C0_9ACTN|nr:ribonuclease domain-containing protein [Actinomadura rayongensis]MXQ65488.1 guanine-specific ribonuclease N1 and T1 [Actinomadura rayongensis]
MIAHRTVAHGALAAVLLLGGAACGTGGEATTAAAPRPAASTALPDVSPDKLPKEAVQTLELIDRGGPFPYRKDGTTFRNRENKLPQEPSGYYREYTVPTPRSQDRGARRVVAGKNGERYYSGDHYRSFARVLWKR